MEAILKEDAKVLVPNKEHKNFTETSEVIPKDTIVEGEFKSIKGKRRGEDFSFRVFITKEGQIIYSNKLKEMRTTEVTLGADSSQSATTIDLKPAETFKTSRILMTVAGAIGGYAYSKKKGCKGNACLKWSVLGAALGYATIYVVDKTRSVSITESK